MIFLDGRIFSNELNPLNSTTVIIITKINPANTIKYSSSIFNAAISVCETTSTGKI